MKVRGGSRVINIMLEQLGATPVGMPVPAVGEALSKGVIQATTIPWEVVPALKVQQIAKNSTGFSGSKGLYTQTFAVAMNKASYDKLPPDLKKVIDANSGLATSAWLGKTQQANDVAGRKPAVDRGNTLYTFTAEQTQEFVKLSSAIDEEWVADMDKRGFKGKELLAAAKGLIAKNA